MDRPEGGGLNWLVLSSLGRPMSLRSFQWSFKMELESRILSKVRCVPWCSVARFIPSFETASCAISQNRARVSQNLAGRPHLSYLTKCIPNSSVRHKMSHQIGRRRHVLKRRLSKHQNGNLHLLNYFKTAVFSPHQYASQMRTH